MVAALIRRCSTSDPRRGADAAWASADVLRITARVLGNPALRRAADAYDRAAGAPYGRTPRCTYAGDRLRLPRLSACCPWPNCEQRIPRRPRGQPGHADRCRRGPAGGPALCRAGGRSAASRRAPLGTITNHRPGSRTGRGSRARLRCSSQGCSRRTHGAPASLPGPGDTAPHTRAKVRGPPRETAAKLRREASPEPRGVALRPDFCHLITARLDDKLMTNDLQAQFQDRGTGL